MQRVFRASEHRSSVDSKANITIWQGEKQSRGNRTRHADGFGFWVHIEVCIEVGGGLSGDMNAVAQPLTSATFVSRQYRDDLVLGGSSHPPIEVSMA